MSVFGFVLVPWIVSSAALQPQAPRSQAPRSQPTSSPTSPSPQPSQPQPVPPQPQQPTSSPTREPLAPSSTAKPLPPALPLEPPPLESEASLPLPQPPPELDERVPEPGAALPPLPSSSQQNVNPQPATSRRRNATSKANASNGTRRRLPSAESEDDDTRIVVVTGTRTEKLLSESPVATQVYTRQEVVDTGAENLEEVLAETPGLVMTRGIGGSGVQLQGLGPEYTVILIDGQRINGQVNGVIDLSRFPAENIGQIELIRGAGSLLYGSDAIAGAINILPRRPTEPYEGEVHYAYGSFETHDASAYAALSRGLYAGSVTAGWHNTAGWDADPSDPRTTGAAVDQWNLSTIQTVGAPKGRLRLVLLGSYLRQDKSRVDGFREDLDADGNYDDTGEDTVIDRRNVTETANIILRPTLHIGRSRLSLIGHYSLFHDQLLQVPRTGTIGERTFTETFDNLGEVKLQYDLDLDEHVVTASLEGQFEYLTAQRLEPPDVDRQRYAVVLQDDWTPTRDPRIVVLAGVRLDHDSLFGFSPTPRISLMFAPNRRCTFRAGFGRGYRSPSFRELYINFLNAGAGYEVLPNPLLEPEISWNTSVSVDFQPWRWLAVTANAFDNRLQNLIAIQPDGTRIDPEDGLIIEQYRNVNIGSAITRGVETTGVVRILDALQLDGSYTYLYTRDVENDVPLSGRANHSGTAGLRYHRDAWGTTFRVRCQFVGRRTIVTLADDDVTILQHTLRPFTTLDARLSQTLYRYVQLFVGVDNILDAGNPTNNPLTPRSYSGGITVRY